jgi:glycosyltransferase involved in cell wall biosynthesis
MKSFIKNVEKIKEADIVVGIPSFNEADNIDFVTQIIDRGLQRYYKNFKKVIINVDNDSPDGTKDVFLNTVTKNPKIYISTGKGIRGKGNNFFNLFNYAKQLGAKAVMVIDADMKSVTPEWINLFLDPILKGGYEYVTPYYARNEYDGTITNNIVYPLLLGLYGIDLRQPIGGDFAFSEKLIDEWLNHKWHKTTKQYGIDIFMTLGAVLGNYKLCQVGVGEKIHKPSAPKLGPMFSQVVATMFKNIISSRQQWETITKRKKIPLLGKKKLGNPQPLGVDYKSMRVTSIFEYKMNREILKRALSPKVFEKIDKMYERKHIYIGKSLWAKIIFDSIFAYETTDLNMGLIEALRPLYFGRVISFIKETMDLNYEESEKEIVEQANLFWELRQYLIEK